MTHKLLYITNGVCGFGGLEQAFFIKAAFANVLKGKFFALSRKNANLKKFKDNEVLNTAKFINQEPPLNSYKHDEKFEMAETLLKKYARAKLVITSRIHCALPYLALGTQVIFVNAFGSFLDSCRFDEILELFNRIDINSKIKEHTSNFDLKGKIDENTEVKNLEKHHGITSTLKSRFKDLLNVL